MPPLRLEDLYAVLEVPRNADIVAIKKSYRKLVLKYHPDKNPDDRETAQKKIRELNDAYAVLGNPQKRADHEKHAQFTVVLTQASATTRSLLGVNWSGNNVSMPSQFLVIPVGNADKFLRDSDRSFVFHSREDAKSIEFIEFFAFSTFGLQWLPDASSAFSGHRARFGAPCRLQRCSPVLAALGVTEHLRASNSQVDMWKPPSDRVEVGCVSFGLMAGCMSSSSVKLCSTTKIPGDVADIRILPSPIFQNAYRFESAFYPGHFLAFDPPRGCIMTGTPDQFSVVDFVVEDVRSCMRFQTLDEILLPVVQRLGGESKSVPLTAICQDHSVRLFFQMGMQCEWDFDDFAIYFHAHSETWDYDEQNRSLRICRDQPSTSKQKTIENQPAKRQKLEAKRSPTKILVLANLVGPGEVDDDLQEETAEEAEKYGKVNKCIVEELKGVSDEDAVRIFLEFDAVESAAKACDVFNGRIFDGRTVKAWFYEESAYKGGNLKKFD